MIDEAPDVPVIEWNRYTKPDTNRNVLIADKDLHRVTLGWYGYGRWHGAYNTEPRVEAWADMPDYDWGNDK